MVADGTFREDLYFRLNVFNLTVPPLRSRKETIPNLLRIFVHRQNTLLDKHVNSLSKGAEIVLAEYDYPGNVRELENIIEHAMVLCESRQITELDLPEYLHPNRLMIARSSDISSSSAQLAYTDYHAVNEEIVPLVDIEKAHIVKALKRFKYNYSETAIRLGISRSTLWRKIRDYGIEQEEPS